MSLSPPLMNRPRSSSENGHSQELESLPPKRKHKKKGTRRHRSLPRTMAMKITKKKTEALESKSGGSSPSKEKLYKTEICRSFQMQQSCKYGAKCRFAHGEEELRTRDLGTNYKTVLCKSFEREGVCSYGHRCRFIHRETSPVGSPPSDGSEVIISPLLSRVRALSMESDTDLDLLMVSPPMSPNTLSPRSPTLGAWEQSSSPLSPPVSPRARLPFFRKNL